VLTSSSALHSFIYQSDNDFSPANGGHMRWLEPGPVAAQQSLSALTDDNADQPLGIRIIQESYSFDSPYDNFVILRCILVNDKETSVDNIRLGLMLDWDIFDFTANAGGWESADGFAWMAHNANAGFPPDLSEFRGVKLLEGDLSAVQILDDSVAAVPGFGGDGYTDREKALSVTGGTTLANQYRDSSMNLFQVMGAGPMSLSPGARDTVAFAVLGGNTFSDITNAADAAAIKYAEIQSSTDIGDDDPGEVVLPVAFSLAQNYPNPFNPSTTIAFDLPVASDCRLEIFNSLGRQVDLITGRSSAGKVTIAWDAAGLASGVYLYRVTAGDYTASRKMMLLK
jgi:hypothetical protein